MIRSLFMLALPTALLAQAPERTSFYLVSHAMQKADTVVAERVTRTATEMNGEMLDRVGGARVAYSASFAPNGLITRLEMKSFRAAADTQPRTASFTIDGDSVVARVGSAAPAHLPASPEVLAVVNPSAAFIEQMARRAIAIGSDTSGIPLFIAGAPQAVTLIVRRIAPDSLTLSYAGVVMRIAVSPEGRLLGGALPAQQLTIERGPPVDALGTGVDYSAPRDAPYVSEDVTIRTPEGLRLSGTLTIPKGRRTGRAPAVVTISGSGPQDRDGRPMVAGFGEYRPFRELADTLGRRGIAVLRLDDRGVNGSDAGPQTVTSRDLANDVEAAVAYLRTRTEIDPAHIGLVGHSEGGIVAPLVALQDSTVRTLVLMAGFASTGRKIIESQQLYVVDSMAHLTGARRSDALVQYQRATDSLAASVPWWRELLTYDPTPTAKRVRASVLILHGENDHQVPIAEAEKLGAAFREGASRNVTMRTFPATNHLFVTDETGTLDYSKLSSLRVRREVLGVIADWLSAQFTSGAR